MPVMFLQQNLCRRFVHKKNFGGLLIKLYRPSSKRVVFFQYQISLNEELVYIFVV